MEREERSRMRTREAPTVSFSRLRAMEDKDIVREIAEHGSLVIDADTKKLRILDEEVYEAIFEMLQEWGEDQEIFERIGHRLNDESTEFLSLPEGMTMREFVNKHRRREDGSL